MSFFVRERPSNEKHYKYIFGERALFSLKKTDFTFSEVLKDFSNFYDLPYNERLKIAEKYDISTFYIFLDKEKELIFGVDFAKRDSENVLEIPYSTDINSRLTEVLKCPPKDIFDFEPKDEHEKRYFEKYQKKYFEEDEEIIFFEWFMRKFKKEGFEQYLIDYWNQMSIDNFPEEYLTKSISDLKSQIEEGIYNGGHSYSGQNRFFLFGVEKFKRGAEIPFNGYINELNYFWSDNFKSAYFKESLTYMVTGYQRAKFYKFLIEQQKRLLKGEDITKPFEVEEKEKPIELEGFEVAFAIFIIMDLGEIPKKEFEPDLDYFLRVCNELGYMAITYRQYYYDCTNLLRNGAETTKVFNNKMKNLEKVKKYFGNDEKYIKKIDEMINKIKTKSNKK